MLACLQRKEIPAMVTLGRKAATMAARLFQGAPFDGESPRRDGLAGVCLITGAGDGGQRPRALGWPGPGLGRPRPARH